jgi:hypothetical protein
MQVEGDSLELEKQHECLKKDQGDVKHGLSASAAIDFVMSVNKIRDLLIINFGPVINSVG